jgi:hypothetical protein
VAVAATGRRAHGDEHRVGGLDRLGALQREEQPAFADIARDQVIQARLEDRDLALLQALDLAGILVDAGHLVTEVGEARPRHQTHITRANHRYAHRRILIRSDRRLLRRSA